jgi:glycosyltransferase involved in cell wall biosynthesis
MNYRCSIVIRAYNEEEHIGRLLSGVLQQTVKDIQVILVDSGSTDATVSIASRYPVELVHIRPQDFTFGRSLNIGITKAEAEFIIIASAHVYPVYPDWIELLLEPFNDLGVALSYGKQRGTEHSQFSENQIFHQWFPDQPRPAQKHPFCNNANAAIRRSFWEQYSYNEALPGLEDLDWARWAQQQGHGIVYVPEAEVIHEHHETWRGVYNRYRREAMAFKYIYPRETFGLSEFIRLWTGNVFYDMRSALQKSEFWVNWKNILYFRWMQFWGTYQGYRQSGSFNWQLRRAFYYPRMDNNEPEHHPMRTRSPIRYHEYKDTSLKEVSSVSDPEAE